MLSRRRVVFSSLLVLLLASSAAAQAKRAMTVDDVRFWTEATGTEEVPLFIHFLGETAVALGGASRQPWELRHGKPGRRRYDRPLCLMTIAVA